MKTKQQKYEEAVDRNLRRANQIFLERYRGLSLLKAKHLLGIKQSDDRFDEEVRSLLTWANW